MVQKYTFVGAGLFFPAPFFYLPYLYFLLFNRRKLKNFYCKNIIFLDFSMVGSIFVKEKYKNF